MSFLLTIFTPILLLLSLFIFFRQKKNAQKVRSLNIHDKCECLNRLLEPLGYCYIPRDNVFSALPDTRQGKNAPEATPLHMIIDSLSVDFDHQGHTWLLELWKGQCGIHTCAGLCLYYADEILEEPIKMSFSLFRKDEKISYLSGRQWFLTAFHAGLFSLPTDLSMRVCVTFPDEQTAKSFVTGITQTGHSCCSLIRQNNAVTFSFVTYASPQKELLQKMKNRLAIWSTRFWCRVYLCLTEPFQSSADRVLYLYYTLPFLFKRC